MLKDLIILLIMSVINTKVAYYIKLFAQHVSYNEVSSENNVIYNPFYVSMSNKTFNDKAKDWLSESSLRKFPTEIYNFYDTFPLALRILYGNQSYTCEITYKSFTFLSLQTISERIDNYDNFYDIAIIYVGMGHVIILAKMKDNEFFFFRADGGSNEYEREHYFLRYKSLTSDDFEETQHFIRKDIICEKLYTIDEIVL